MLYSIKKDDSCQDLTVSISDSFILDNLDNCFVECFLKNSYDQR